jgi:uncharacterized protein YjgD (DUF1641 family)
MAKAIAPVASRSSRTALVETDELSPELKRELIRLAHGLHQTGTLAFLVGLTQRAGTLSAEMAEWVQSPENRRMLQNLAAMYGLLQEIDPEVLTTVGRAFEGGLLEAGRSRRADRPPSVRALWQEWRDPDVRRGLHVALGFLRGLGQLEPARLSKPRRPG